MEYIVYTKHMISVSCPGYVCVLYDYMNNIVYECIFRWQQFLLTLTVLQSQK